MSNVTDPKSWQGMSMSNAPSQIPLGTPQHAVPDTAHERSRPSSGPHWLHHADATGLSMVLRHLFDEEGTRVVWGVRESLGEHAATEEQRRVDPAHEIDRPAATTTAAGRTGEEAARSLIVIDLARGIDDQLEQVATLIARSPRLLLIACDPVDGDDASSAGASGLARLAERSRSSGLAYVGPIPSGDSRQLLDALSHIKSLGQPTLLHLRSRAPIRPEVAPARRFRQVASEELARLASRDARIMIAAPAMDAEFLQPWQQARQRIVQVDSAAPAALQWCAALASEGGRPFVFMTLEELQNSFGQLRVDVCLKQAAVTILVESGGGGDEEPLSAAALAGFRQLPNLSLMAPKDAVELAQMLAWCAAHDGPAVVWLPDDAEPQNSWAEGPAVELGRAERLSEGSHVAIIAWGPMVAAASLAVDCLAQSGIEATVVNARFAQPLDFAAIEQAVRSCLCTVIVDDADRPGGFGAWVLERLVRAAVAQPLWLVAPDMPLRSRQPGDAHNLCAMRIVERCQWMAEPVEDQPEPVEGVMTVGIPQRPALASPAIPAETSAPELYDEQRQVLAQQFSPFIDEWVAQYERVGARDLYLWRWCLHGLTLTTLPCVAPELRAHACDTKLLSIILCVLLDDVADQHGDGRLLDALLEMAYSGSTASWQRLTAAEQRHGDITRAVWETYWSRVAEYPCYSTYEPVLRYDLWQFLNTMRYSHLINSRPYLLNMAEHDVYTPHNMMMISFATVDLMSSGGFPQAEVGALREVMWHAQCMGRIGNLLSTWTRELVDRDFTSGVFARALVEGDLTLDELEHGDSRRLDAVIRRGNHEAYFLHKWFEHRRRSHALARRIRSIDLTSTLAGHDRFFAMHLGSRGLI